MNRKAAWISAAVAVIVVVVLVAAKPKQKLGRTSTPVQISTSSKSGSSSSPTPAPPASSKVTGVFSGTTETTEYGPVQVEIAVQNGKIVDVKALQYPVDRPRSEFISSQAIPLLREEALQAQSAQINLISGATFTSNGFGESLQSAIEQEHKQAAAG
jgi:uncharacterized protein with FMN-binding domain